VILIIENLVLMSKEMLVNYCVFNLS